MRLTKPLRGSSQATRWCSRRRVRQSDPVPAGRADRRLAACLPWAGPGAVRQRAVPQYPHHADRGGGALPVLALIGYADAGRETVIALRQAEMSPHPPMPAGPAGDRAGAARIET